MRMLDSSPPPRRITRPRAVILGVSGGLGAACAEALGKAGFSIYGVHLDPEQQLARLRTLARSFDVRGVSYKFVNQDAVQTETIAQCMREISEAHRQEGGRVRVLVHALALSTHGPFVQSSSSSDGSNARCLNRRQLESTMSVMAHSLVHWVQALVDSGLLEAGGKVLALTSIGSSRVLQQYGAVSAAKAALEAYVRQLAVELAPLDIAANCIRVGVTDTPAMRRVRGSEQMMLRARRSNPSGRLTQPEQLGELVARLAEQRDSWLTGNVIAFDGGESLTMV